MCLQGEEGGGTGEQCPGRKGSEQVEPDPEQSLVSRAGSVSTRRLCSQKASWPCRAGWVPGGERKGKCGCPRLPAHHLSLLQVRSDTRRGRAQGGVCSPVLRLRTHLRIGVGVRAHDRRLCAQPRGQWEQVHAGKWWPGSRHIPGGPGPTLGPPVWVTLRINTLL